MLVGTELFPSFSEVVKVAAPKPIFKPIAPKVEPGSPEEKELLKSVSNLVGQFAQFSCHQCMYSFYYLFNVL